METKLSKSNEVKVDQMIDDAFEETTQTIVHIPPGMSEIKKLLDVKDDHMIECEEVVSSLSKDEIKKMISENTDNSYIIGEKDNHLFILNMSA